MKQSTHTIRRTHSRSSKERARSIKPPQAQTRINGRRSSRLYDALEPQAEEHATRDDDRDDQSVLGLHHSVDRRETVLQKMRQEGGGGGKTGVSGPVVRIHGHHRDAKRLDSIDRLADRDAHAVVQALQFKTRVRAHGESPTAVWTLKQQLNVSCSESHSKCGAGQSNLLQKRVPRNRQK